MNEQHFDYYFAYGSNLNHAQMLTRCPGSKPVCRFDMAGWRLVFRKYADIIPAEDYVAHGALYTITPDDECSLDHCEGYKPHAISDSFYVKRYADIVVDGQPQVVMYYVMLKMRPVAPSVDYVHTVRTGYNEWAIDNAALDDALEYSQSIQYGARA